MATEEWMRRLGEQDEIKEEVLRYFNARVLSGNRFDVWVVVAQTHKERVEPKP